MRAQGKNRQMRAYARHDQWRIAAFRQGNDGGNTGEVVAGIHGSQCNGFVAAAELLLEAMPGVLTGGVLFCPEADPVHGFDRFDRIVACRRFSREHDRVGVIQCGVGHVRDLGTGRHRAVDHRLHHLCGSDHDLVLLAGAGDDEFLDADQFGVADFHTQIATGYHDAIAGADQSIQGLFVGHGLGAFDLGNQPGL